MSLDDHAPCWPDADPDPACCPAWAAADPALKLRSQQTAAFILWSLSGRRHGVCTVTVRPCGEDCANNSSTWYARGMYPMLTGRGWVNCVDGQCDDCPGPCSCCHVCKTTLVGPAQEIVSVMVDGAVVPASAYRIDDHRELVRVDGECWPRCPDLEAACDLVGGGAFCVTYTRGLPLDAAAMSAYNTYACQLLAACTSDDCCVLPQRVTEITRQGVTVAMLDPFEFLDQGRTGVLEVDMWLRAVNPRGLQEPSRVYSPDVRTPRITTWP